MKRYDVVTFGETMLRLSPAGHQALEQAEAYEARCAGTESNVAVALARLGLRAAWVSRLVDDPIGRRIVGLIRQHGVDVSHVVWVAEGRNGVIFMEIGRRPRPSEVVYDRAGSAASQLRPDEINWDILAEAKHLHVSGITPALSDSCSGCVATALERARDAGLTVSFDVNYRRKLWAPQQAAEVLSPMMSGVDVLFLTSDDSADLFGIMGESDCAVREVAERFGPKWTVMTLGGEGAVGYAGEQVLHEPVHPTDVVDRIGAGDAFVGGFLYGFFRDDLAKALKYGLAMAALKMTTPGDLSFATLEQVEELASGGLASVKR